MSGILNLGQSFDFCFQFPICSLIFTPIHFALSCNSAFFQKIRQFFSFSDTEIGIFGMALGEQLGYICCGS